MPTKYSQEIILIDGESITVTIIQTSKTVWKASGDFRGRQVSVTGSSHSNAYQKWQTAADWMARE